MIIHPEFSAFFKKNRQDFDAVLFDIDGTLASGTTPLPGAGELLKYLDSEKIPYLLLTNDSCNSPEEKAGYLNNGGVPARAETILSAGNALNLWAEQTHYSGELFFQLGSLGTPSYATEANISVTTDTADIRKCRGVICGEGDFDWQYPIEAAFNLLYNHPEYPLIVANPDSYWPSLTTGVLGVGAGAIARFICQVLADAGVKVSPVYLGKPYPPIYECVYPFLRKHFPELSLRDPARLLVLGDSLASDIAGANSNGMTSALILTGITTVGMLENAEKEKFPKLIFNAL